MTQKKKQAIRRVANAEKTRSGRTALRESATQDAGNDPAVAADDGMVESMSLFVRWARRELHDKTVAETHVDIDRSAAAIIGALYFHEPVRLSDLAEHLGLDRSTVSRQVAAVVSQGWVQRSGDANDARAAVLNLTTKGHALRRKLANSFDRICAELVASWAQADRREFVRLMGKLAEEFRRQGVY